MQMKRRMAPLALALLMLGLSWGCKQARVRQPREVSTTGLRLERAVIYQNGVGYFERRGKITGDALTVRIRADQVNDFLKSLTVIDMSKGKAVSVSLPLDRAAAREVMSLANQLKEGITLPALIASLKGTEITLIGDKRSVTGRILAIDEVAEQKANDWRVSVMGESAMETMMLKEVETVYVADAFIVLGLHKGLDAAATGGIFKVVDVTVQLDHAGMHDLMLAYVVACPAWKPSYRLVVGENHEVLLQGWAVVDNVTGEPWDRISLSLTSGAPLAFQYDLYTPRFVDRPDLTHVASEKTARAQVGETSYGEEAEKAAEEAPAEEPAPAVSGAVADEDYAPMKKAYKEKVGGGGMRRSAAPKSSAPPPPPAPAGGTGASYEAIDDTGGLATVAPPAEVSVASLQESARSMVKAVRASGAVRYDMQEAVSVPDRSSTLVSILNHRVPGEEAFLYTPEGAGQGYEQNPYRVVRFKNNTGFILEPGPISIYSGGTFVGEGIGEAISDQKQATIPFAVDPSILVTTTRQSLQEGARLMKIVRGLMTVESFDRIKTTYTVKGGEGSYRLYVRHIKAGGLYNLKDRPADLEDLGDAYMIPIDVKAKAKETAYTAVEQTPVVRSLTIWDNDAFIALELAIKDVADLPPAERAKLEEILVKRRQIAKIDTNLEHLQMNKNELDQRMYQTRENIIALKKNKGATALKSRLAAKLEEQAKEADDVTRQIVTLTSERQELQVAMEEMLADLTFNI